LAFDAAIRQPTHVTDLIGAPPGRPGDLDRWIALASRIEAYREQWSVPADQLREPPVDSIQHREWNTAIRAVELLAEPLGPALEPHLDHGLGIEL